MTTMVAVRDVFRVHPSPEGGVAALQGLTLDVREGEICVVLGPSGSGKSTLVRIVAGFDRTSAGSVETSPASTSPRCRCGATALATDPGCSVTPTSTTGGRSLAS